MTYEERVATQKKMLSAFAQVVVSLCDANRLTNLGEAVDNVNQEWKVLIDIIEQRDTHEKETKKTEKPTLERVF